MEQLIVATKDAQFNVGPFRYDHTLTRCTATVDHQWHCEFPSVVVAEMSLARSLRLLSKRQRCGL